MNPQNLSLSETIQVVRENWVNRFREEDYSEIADAIEEIAETHSDTKFMEDATIEFLKTKTSDNKCEVYLEAMQGDFKAKMRGEHLDRGKA